MKKLIGFILIFGASVFCVRLGWQARPHGSALAQKILKDLQTAAFPETIHSLKDIKILIHTEHPEWKNKILNSIYLPFAKKEDGKNWMQIDVIENFTPREEAILILQINIFEVRSKNKIWESSRLFHISKEDLKDLSL